MKSFLCLIPIFLTLASCGRATPIVPVAQTSTAAKGYHDYVVDFSLSPDGKTIVLGTTLHLVILDAESMALIKTLPIAYGKSKFNLNGKLLYISGHYSSLLLNTENWEAPASYEADWNYLHYGSRVQVSPNGLTFAFASGGAPNECDGAHKAFAIRRINTDEILYYQISCAHWVSIVYKYNVKGDRLFLGYELANYENDQSAPNLLAIIDTENGNVIREYGLTEPVEFIEDDLGIIYLRDKSQFLLWNLDTEDYVGTSKTAKLKLGDNLFLNFSLDGESYITNSESSPVCKIGTMYGGTQEYPRILPFQQANGRLAYLDSIQDEISYWDILNCRLIQRIKLTDIASH